MRPQHWFRCHWFNNLESTQSEDACKVTLHIKAFKSWEEIFYTYFLNVSLLNSSWVSRIGPGPRLLPLRIFTIYLSFGINIGISGSVVLFKDTTPSHFYCLWLSSFFYLVLFTSDPVVPERVKNVRSLIINRRTDNIH